MRIRVNNLIIIVVFALMIECTSKGKKFNGYYYNQQNREIYFFANDKVEIYSFPDSTISKIKYDIEKNNIRIGNEIYKYHSANDTLILNNFSEEGINLKLLNFNFKPFDLKKIISKSFKMTVERTDREFNQPYKEEQFFKIDKRLGFNFFYNDERSTDTLYGGYSTYKGKYLNKFPFFRSRYGTAFIVCNYKDNKVEILTLLNGALFTQTEFTSKESDSLLYGKWRQVEGIYNIDIFKEYAYFHPVDSTYEDYRKRVEKIKKGYDLSNIEFTKDDILQRYFHNDTTISHEMEFGITNQYIFIENFNKEYDFEVLKIEKLTKDSLLLRINESKIHYKYVRF